MIEKKLPEDCRLAFSGSFQENSCPFLKKKKKSYPKKKKSFSSGTGELFLYIITYCWKKIYLMWVTGLNIVIFFQAKGKDKN